MSTRDYILRFLNQPETFATGASDPEVWLHALREVATPLLKEGGGPALRPAQVTAWEGLAPTRAGLVLGPPGTGKTHLLAWLIVGYILARRSAGLPARVFVSAFTRNAIGNLLDGVAGRVGRFAPEAFDVHYLGAAPPAGLSEHIKHRASVAKQEGEAAFADLDAEAVVVGASVWQLHRLLSHKKAPGDGVVAPLFDLVCIDEASQLVLSQGLMALSGLKPDGRIVVAGDDRQLPPIRAGRDVDVSGRQLGSSLYAFLKSAGAPEFALEETFRLNGPLTTFPEKTFYPGKYRSADDVRDARLALKPDWREGLEPWEAHALDPDWPIAVLVHDGPSASSSNPFEAWASARLLEKLAERLEDVTEADGAYKSDLWRERIAAVSPHRAQNTAIRNALPAPLRANAFVETVDRIQGKERDAVVLSYCVADTEFALAEADFIFAPERLNVAVTRARHKLIVLISRRLLEASPVDQEQMDKAEGLREFVFDAALMREVEIVDNTGAKVDVHIRLVGFEDSGDLIDPPVQAPVAAPSAQALTDEDKHLLQAVRDVALSNSYGTAASFELEKRLGRKPVLPGLSRLQAGGNIDLWRIITDKANFWNARPLDPPRRIFPADFETVKGRAEEVINQSKRGRKPPIYEEVRRQFAWVNVEGRDVVRPSFDRLRDEGLIQYSSDGEKLRIEWTGVATLEPLPEPPAAPALSDEDFAVLNALETLEAKRINFGVFEGWTSAATLADGQAFSRPHAQAALGRLAANGWVLFAGEGRVRSRMAELAREVRYVKQRFDRDDADKRPFLVRSLKVELRDRNKPLRSEPLAAVFDDLAAELGGTHAQALMSLKAGLLEIWNEDATIAGFQRRSLEALSRAWAGGGTDAVVISADTGAGKTEAAALPLIAGAAADRLAGVKGVRAVLAYPRIRLATNQAQRLVRYAAILSRQPGAPRLTVGMQFKGTPNRLDALQDWDRNEGWRLLSDRELIFPLFGCPECGQTLHLQNGGGDAGADRLACVACDWSFDSWIGSKNGLRETPPALFIITTDSLHQWMHNPIAGRLFGDDPAYAPPRAVMADEIHLYSHVHGAQVALALQRLSARAAINAPDAPAMLMVGMSATLGDPAATWGRLAGRAEVLSIAASEEEKEINPRGREYFYFIQPEVESRGADIAGASTTIQSLMCLAHGMRRRTDNDGGFRSVVFLDSIDKVRRLHGDYTDAEDGKELASYRTRKYPEDPATGELPTQCCGEPYGCDRFQGGECWVFAAQDAAQIGAQGLRRPGQPLSVIDRPVTSASTGRVEDAIKAADVVFATSSLEVGYDDPDITLVYQHYAPQNLASFVQRKGRGGRGSDDRPITAVTLSIYTSRDSWWFKRPWTMLEPTGFNSPLNPDNFFVRRGQIVSTLLDAFARYERRFGGFDPHTPPAAALAEAEALIQRVFGGPVWEGYAADLGALWALALAQRNGIAKGTGVLPRLRGELDWAPDLLFDSINLPRLNIIRSGEADPRAEDVSLAAATVSPGGATRRYHAVEVDWRPPVAGQGPWLAAQDYDSAQRLRPFGDDPNAWLERLPREARTLLPGLEPEYVRPRQITLQRLGQVHGATWIADFGLDAGDNLVPARDAPQNRQISHQSHSHLRGFPVLKPADDEARPLSTGQLKPWVEAFNAFLGDGVGGKTTGLGLARVFWGADAELILPGPPRETLPITQVFTSPGKGPTLHGYHVQTEGVRYRLDAGRLGNFLDRETARLTVDDQARKRVVGALVRWKVESGAQSLGLNMFQMRRAGELIYSALADPAYLDRLNRIAFLWNKGDIASLFEDVRADLLACHPLLSPERVLKVAEAFSDDRLKPILSEALRAAGDPAEIRAWLQSAVVHSLALRLKDSFVHIGHGDDRQVLVHAALPLQFGADLEGGRDIIICEVGNHGDGTTRAFVGQAEDAASHWRDGFLGDCPNATEDAALDRLFSLQEHHAGWRALDPNDPAALQTLAEPLGLDPDIPLPAGVLRVLFGVEAVGSERFDLYDLAVAVRGSSLSLQARLGRPPTAWEATSVAVRGAETQPDSVLNHLLAAYGGLEEGLQEEGLSARGRLADQVYRLSARLCVDGCPACVHRPSDLMSEGLMEASTSRALLSRFLCEAA